MDQYVAMDELHIRNLSA